MDTRGELVSNLNGILEDVDDMFTILNTPEGRGRSRLAMIASIDAIETRCRLLRAALIRAARAQGIGIKQDGHLDLRFNKNRVYVASTGDDTGAGNGHAHSEEPAPAPRPGLTRSGKPDLRYGKSKRSRRGA